MATCIRRTAAGLLLALAALLATPMLGAGGLAHAQTQTEIWSSTVTPGAISSLVGYWDRDPDIGAITDKDFTYDGVTYSVIHIRVSSNGGLQLNVDQTFTATAKANLVLDVDGSPFPLSDSTVSGNDVRNWNSAGLSWTVGTDVALKMFEQTSTNDATLSSLVLNDGTNDLILTPTFATDTTSYAASVANAVSQITVTPTKGDTDASVEYLDASEATITDADGMTPGQQVDLDVGENTIKVKVTAEGAMTTETYTVVVTRALADTVTISIGDVTVDESAGQASMTVSLSPASGCAINVAHTVDWSTADDSAVEPHDYEMSSGAISFAACENTKTITVDIKDDLELEDTEMFSVVLSNYSHPDLEIAKATGTVTIRDEDTATVSIGDMTFGEGAGQKTLTVSLDADACIVAFPFDVNFTVTAGTATSGVGFDFIALASGTLRFASCQLSTTITVFILEDTEYERDPETFTVTLAMASGADPRITLSKASATITITDNDPVPLDVLEPHNFRIVAFPGDRRLDDPAIRLLWEHPRCNTGTQKNFDPDGRGHLRFRVRYDGQIIEKWKWTYANYQNNDTCALLLSEEGGGVPGADFSPGTRHTVSVTEVKIRRTNDARYAVLLDESAPASVTNQCALGREQDFVDNNGCWEGWPAPVAVGGSAIRSADKGKVQVRWSGIFNFGGLLPTSGTGFFEYILSVKRGKFEADGSRTKTLHTFKPTDLNRNHYKSSRSQYEFNNEPDSDAGRGNAYWYRFRLYKGGVSMGTFLEVECPAAPASGEVSCTAGAPIITGSGPSAQATALSALSVFDAGANEAGGAIGFRVTLDPAASGTVTVDYATADGTATAGADYDATSGTLTFAPGETAKTVSVPLIDDTVEDGGETFTLTLSNAVGAMIADGEATGAILNTEAPPEPDALTASFSGVPPEHDGATAFTFQVLFSEPVGIGYRTLRDEAFTATGGAVTKTKRVDGRNDLREIHVEPAGYGDVSLTLAGGRACGATGAVCTKSGKALSNTLTATVKGPVALAVADARVKEAAGATVDFAVTLSRQATGIVTVDYATSDGTATAGTDYTAASGTLSFAPGETQKTVSVSVLDDAHDEGEERFTLTLWNASGAVIADGAATGTIENTDPLQRAWLARFGRTVADHVMEAVGARIEGKSLAQAQLTLGGYRVLMDVPWPGEGAGGALSASLLGESGLDPGLARTGGLWTGADLRSRDFGRDGDDSPARAVSMSEFMLASSFHLASAHGEKEDEGGRWSLWGRGLRSSFSGKEGALTLDGDVTTGVMGADYESGKMLMGVALALSSGDGSYTMGDMRGELESTLASAHPYLRYEVSERLSVWGVLGLGEGKMTLDMENTGERIETDLSLTMAAAGLRGVLLSAGGYDLAWKSDVRIVRTESEAAAGLAEADAQTRRLRLAIEGSREVKLAEGVLTPSIEVGLRYDGGDAETGSGLELGGGLRYANSGRFALDVRARGLLAHEERDYEEWGVSASLVLSPGAGGRGLSARVASNWGAASGGVDRLWSQRAAGLARSGGFEPGASLNAEAGYGIDYLGGLLTPYTGVALSESGETYRAGGRFRLGERFTMSIEGDLREKGREEKPVHGVTLRGSLHW